MAVKLFRKLSLQAIFLCIVAAMLNACGSSQAPATNTSTSVPNTLPATSSAVATTQAQSASKGATSCDLATDLSSKSGSTAIVDLQTCQLVDTAPMDVVWDSADFSVVASAAGCQHDNSVGIMDKQKNQKVAEIKIGDKSSPGGDVSYEMRYVRLNLQPSACGASATSAATPGK